MNNNLNKQERRIYNFNLMFILATKKNREVQFLFPSQTHTVSYYYTLSYMQQATYYILLCII